MGKLPFTYDVKLENNSTSKISSARVIPKALNEIVKAEIEQIIKDGIKREVSDPTDWLHPIVITKKSNGEVRIFMDPRALNSLSKQKGILLDANIKKYFLIWRVLNTLVFWMLLQHFYRFCYQRGVLNSAQGIPFWTV